MKHKHRVEICFQWLTHPTGLNDNNKKEFTITIPFGDTHHFQKCNDVLCFVESVFNKGILSDYSEVSICRINGRRKTFNFYKGQGGYNKTIASKNGNIDYLTKLFEY